MQVEPDETAALARLPEELLFQAPGRPAGHKVVGHDQNGCCPMLVNDRCSIYEDRPRSCRSYDCRVFAAAGIAAGGADKHLVTEQVQRWVFEYPDPQDTARHEAVQAAAKFLMEHPECTDVDTGQGTQLALLAIKVHELFISASDADAASPEATAHEQQQLLERVQKLCAAPERDANI